MEIYQRILINKALNKKSLAVLIDPDGVKLNNLELLVDLANLNGVDFFFVGGSHLLNDSLDKCLEFVKENSDIPIVLFPGNEMQLNENADAILYLSLISGRNPEYLISKHVATAPKLKKMGIEVISTGYMLIHGVKQSSTSYITSTNPIPPDKHNIAISTAMASQFLGHKIIYLEGGSGSSIPIESALVQKINHEIDLPIIVGGGIRTSSQMKELYVHGADIVVVGTSIEQNPSNLVKFCQIKNSIDQVLVSR